MFVSLVMGNIEVPHITPEKFSVPGLLSRRNFGTYRAYSYFPVCKWTNWCSTCKVGQC